MENDTEGAAKAINQVQEIATGTDHQVQEVPKATDQLQEVAKIDAVDKVYEQLLQEHLVTAERAKSQYERLYREMVDKLSLTHFEPLNKALLQHEQVALLDSDEVLQKCKDKLLAELLPSLDTFWSAFNVSDSIAGLELLKQRYKKYEGHNWNVADMAPQERSLPTLIRLKLMSKRFLDIQIAEQNKQLEELMSINSNQRARIKEISKRRIFLQEAMERNLKEHEQLKERLLKLTDELPFYKHSDSRD